MNLSALELASIQAAASGFLGAGTAVIWKASEVGDGQGGATTTWGASGTADCRVSASGMGTARDVAAKLTVISPWLVTLPHDTNITVADRIMIGTRTLDVQAVLAPETWEAHRRVLCSEVL